ncbi:tetratricopeptide repeat protein [Streptomyces sp. NPDC015220]|uniref:tetratricopeptide repeat protein n=1 Tax=Streptomyces sp. NPDC015220 TaxID=3364947 RepID=UPI0037001C52
MGTARDSGQRALEARSHNLLGMAYGQTGRMDESLAEFRHASELWEVLDDRHQLARASNNLGILARLRGDLLEAVRCHERAIRLFHEAGDDNGRARALTNLGVVHQRLGHHAEAISAHERAVEIFRAQDDQYRLGQTMGDLAKAARLAGRYGESIECYEESLRVVRLTGSRLNEAEQLWGLPTRCTTSANGTPPARAGAPLWTSCATAVNSRTTKRKGCWPIPFRNHRQPYAGTSERCAGSPR